MFSRLYVFSILDERVEDTIRSLTRLDVPRLAIFKGVDEVAITVATSPIFNVNSKALRTLADKFVPIEGMDMISTGLTVMHYTPNRNRDIKNINQRVCTSFDNYLESVSLAMHTYHGLLKELV